MAPVCGGGVAPALPQLTSRELLCNKEVRSWLRYLSSSQSSHHPQEVLLAQFSLYVHKSGLKPDSFHFYLQKYQILYY